MNLKLVRLLFLSSVLLVLMAGCGGDSEPAIATPYPTYTPYLTFTSTPLPIATPTAIPTPSPTPMPTQVLPTPASVPHPTPTPTSTPTIVGTVSFQIDVQEVTTASQLGKGSIVGPSLIRLKDGRYRLYLQAREVGLHGKEQRDMKNIISLISTDGIQWDAEPGIRIQHGSLTDIDSEAGEPAIYLGLDDRYYMAYTGRYMGVNPDGVSQEMHRVVFAVSDDGLNWTKLNQHYAGSVVDSKTLFASSADVNIVNGQYVIYYTGGRKVIRATSQDGLAWVRQELTFSAGHDSTMVKYDGIYYMFAKMPEGLAYERNPDTRLDLLVMTISQDGVNWSNNYYQVVVENVDGSEVIAENLQDPSAILGPDGSVRIFLNNDGGKGIYSIKPASTLPKLASDIGGDGGTTLDQPRQRPTKTLALTTPFKPSLEPSLEDIPVESAVSYGSGATVDGPPVDLLLDLFLPDTDGLGPRPLAVYIHRGAFVSGSRGGPGFYKQAAQRGWVVASIDYRLRDDNPLPGPGMQKMLDALGGSSASALYRSVVAAIEDTLMALDYLLDRAEELYIDPDRIVLMGASAGAVTSLNIAYAVDNFGIDRPDIAAVVDLWGSLPESFGEESTMDPGEPPLLIIHGTEDTVVEFTRALNLVKGVESAGIPYEFHPQEGAGHGFGEIDLGTDTTADGRSLESAVFEFLDRVLYQSEMGVR